MRKFVTLAAVLAAVVMLPVASGAPAPVVAAKPDTMLTEQQRNTSGLSRSFNRANCPPGDCPERKSVQPTPPPPAPAPKSCTKIVNSQWKGICPKQPSIEVLKRIAREVLAERGWNSDAQWECLDKLVYKESSWNPYSENKSKAYGLPQALPGTKMAEFGADWGHNPRTQLRWMMKYIANRYGQPCDAWAAWNRQYDRNGHHWY